MASPLDCPGMDSWQALFADAVSPDLRESYERHLESCADCQERLHRAGEGGEAVRRLGRRVGDPTLAPADPTLVQVLERLHEGKAPVRRRPVEPPDLYFLRPSDTPGVLGTLGGYEVRGVIGQGGMGVVLRAFDPALHRLVAIKVLAPALAGSATARRRFTREAQAAAAVCHDHVVAVHGVSEADGLPYLVMQYVAGESLEDRLDRTGPLEVVETVRIGLQTASALAAAHAQGLIHRDVKPANILLEDGLARVKITDFGLARTADDVGLTQAGVVAGTPEYMAPEQARGEPVDHRADLFSLGSVLYACCTGLPPFRGPTALAVLRRVSERDPRPIRSLNPEVPAWLEAVILRLLAKDPAERFQTAAEVGSLLEGYLAHLRQPTTVCAPELRSPPAGVGASAPRRGSRPAGWFRRPLLQAVVLLVAGLGVVALLKVLNAPPPQPAPAPAFYQDFRGGRTPVEPLYLFGPDADAVVKPEAGGLRLTLPPQRPTTDPVGVILTAPVTGDFEVTAGYELLQNPPPRAGWGAGFEIYIMTATQGQEAIGFSRVLRVDGANVYLCQRMYFEDGKRQYRQKFFPAPARAGRMRVTRKGAEVTFWAADAGTGDFEELARFDLGPEDLKMVRLAANPGKAQELVDLRIVDLKVRSDGPIAAQADDAASPPGAPAKSGRRAWLAVAGAVGLVVVSSLLVGAWLSVRRSRRAEKAGAYAPARDEDKAAPAAPPIAFGCPACGKNLKVKAEFAGKTGKCPHCGKAVPVPDTNPTTSGAAAKQ
jgi:Protein kinase domain